MEKTARLVGFFAAHAIWSVSDGELLIPLLGLEMPDGARQMSRLMADSLQEGVENGRTCLSENRADAARAVLIYDGYLTTGEEKRDALLIEACCYGATTERIEMAIPYRSAQDAAGFAVHRPKFLEVTGPDPDFQRLGSAFFDGVDQHQQGAPVWNAHLDETI